MDKRIEFNNALKEAMKSKDTVTSSTMRLVLAALKDRDIAARGTGNSEGVSETEILSMLQSMIKQREESSQIYADAGRDDLASKEQAEIEVIERFLPAQMGDSEVEGAVVSLINELGAEDIKDMGKVMGELKTRYAGQLDMSKASGLVKQKLCG